MEAKSLLNEYYTVPILTKLTQIWKVVLNFRLACCQFPDSELLINILVTLDQSMVAGMAPKNTLDFNNLIHSKDVVALHYIWSKSLLDFHAILKIIQILEEPQYQISKETAQKIVKLIEEFRQNDMDSILKSILFQYSVYKLIEQLPAFKNILRVLGTWFLKEEGLLEIPILYHNSYLDIFLIFQNTSQVSENMMLYFLSQFQNIFILAEIILTSSREKTISMIGDLEKDTSLAKLISNKKVFSLLFGQLFIKIPILMKNTGWKRDKAARLLNRLCKENLFVEKKIGKDKIFINMMISDLFTEIKNNSIVQQLISPLEKDSNTLSV